MSFLALRELDLMVCSNSLEVEVIALLCLVNIHSLPFVEWLGLDTALATLKSLDRRSRFCEVSHLIRFFFNKCLVMNTHIIDRCFHSL